MARSEVVQNAAHAREGGGAGRRTARPTPCELSFGETAGLRQVTLANGVVRAEILLDKGANVRQFWHVPTGARTLAEAHDWAERLAEFHRSGCRGSSYSDCYEGGWQDVLPARAEWDGGATGEDAGVGEASIVPSGLMHAACTPAAAQVVCRARLPRCGLEVVKRFSVRRGMAALTVQTTVRNVSGRDVRLSRRLVGPARRTDQLLYVAVHQEEVRIGATEDHHLHNGVVIHGVEQGDQPDDERPADEVRRRIVDRHDLHGTFCSDTERAKVVVHRVASSQPCQSALSAERRWEIREERLEHVIEFDRLPKAQQAVGKEIGAYKDLYPPLRE